MAENYRLLFSALLITVIIGWTESFCPTDSNLYQTRTISSKCYATSSNFRLTWSEADAYCKNSSNGRLVQFSSYSLKNSLRSWLSYSFWTGGYRSNETTADSANGTWYWSLRQDDERLYEPWWADDALENSIGSCLTSGGPLAVWQTADCDQQLPFVCEYTCSHVINATNGIITSPNYPSSYNSNTYCEWIIDVQRGNAILEFESFRTEGSGSPCFFDYIKVWRQKNHSLIGEYCGSTVPPSITTGSRYMYITFTTDGSVQYSGFSATVRSSTVPLVRRAKDHGVVTSPNFPQPYEPYVTTNWQLEIDGSGTIALKFTDFNLTADNSGSCMDSLEIREGNHEGLLLVKLCGGDNYPSNITSATGSLYLSLTANSSTVSTGFRAVFYKLEDSCVHVISSGGGTITSPGYPSYYPPNLNCAWYIDVLEGVAKINFEDVDLPYSFSCSGDKIVVYDSYKNNATALKTYCSSSSRSDNITSSSRYLTIFFRTNSRYSDDGFKANFRSSTNCSFVAAQLNGFITSPNYPGYYDPYTNCTWSIDVLNNTAVLQLTSFNLHFSTNCESDRLEIYDGNSTSAPLIGRYCGLLSNTVINASTSKVFIRMITDGTISRQGFQLNYWSSGHPCPEFLRSSGFNSSILVWNNTCYGKALSSIYSRTSALNFCEDIGADMLYFESEDELAAVGRWSSGLWTGGYRRRTTSSVWYWTTKKGDILMPGGSKSNMWYGDEPSLGLYIYFNNGKLYDWSSFTTIYKVACKMRQPNTNGSSTASGQRKSCTAPPNIRSGSYAPMYQEFKSGANVTYYCDTGFEMMGNATLTCVTGLWLPHIPVCEESASPGTSSTACAPPPDIIYGSFVPRQPLYSNGSTLTVRCDTGFILTGGANNVVCVNSNWQGTLPHCHKAAVTLAPGTPSASCAPPPDVSFGSLSPKLPSYSNGSSLSVKCNTGYVLSGESNKTITCLNGNWQGVLPSCIQSSGGKVDTPAGTAAQSSGQNSNYNNKNYDTLMAATVSVICILIIAIIVGVVFFFIYRRRVNPHSNLVEMQ